MEKKKKKQEKELNGGGPSNPLGDIFSQEQDNGKVMIMHGPYAESLAVSGMSVEKVRKKFSDRFDIDPGSVALVDGKEINDENFSLEQGSVLMFTKKAGEKG